MNRVGRLFRRDRRGLRASYQTSASRALQTPTDAHQASRTELWRRTGSRRHQSSSKLGGRCGPTEAAYLGTQYGTACRALATAGERHQPAGLSNAALHASEQNSYIRPSRSDVNAPPGFVQPGAAQFPLWSWFRGDDTVEVRSELRSRLLLGDVELVVTLGVVAHGLDCTLGAGRLPCAARRSRRARHGRETDIEDRKSRVAIPTDGRRWLSWPDDSPTITPAMRARVLEVFGEEYQR